MVGPAKAMGMGITVFAVLIMTVVGAGMMPRMSGMMGSALPFGTAGGNSTESAQGLKALAAQNEEMKDTMRKEIDMEASAMIEKCAQTGECSDLEFLRDVRQQHNEARIVQRPEDQGFFGRRLTA